MPGPLTYAAITLLARDRIGQIRRDLKAKQDAGNAKELELHVLYLATEAERMMNASQPVITPPVRLYGPPLTDHVSRFTLLGAIGPDLPRFAAYFAPGQRWLFNALHKGTPDEHRERVLVNSTNLVFDFWKRVGPFIDADISDASKRAEAKQKMQAYVLGHLCHVAADVLAHPYFESLESAAPPVVPRPMTRDDVAGAFDVRIADQFFGQNTDTRNKKWADWFPTPGDVPGAFAKAMSASIESLYGARAQGLPAFEEEFTAISPTPPALSPDLINEAIHNFRNIIEIERVWNLADWLGATVWMFIPMAFAPLGALKLTLGKDLSRALTPADGPDAERIRRYESIVYPVAAASTIPLISMVLVSINGRGLRAEGITGWVQAAVSVAGLIGFFATLGGAGTARWALWFWTPLILALAQTIFAIIRGSKENIRKLLWLGPALQIAVALLFMLLYRAWLHDGVEKMQKSSHDRTTLDDIEIGLDLLGWLGVVAGVWFLSAVLCRKFFSATVPEDRNSFKNGEPSQFLRLYDDVALVHDLGKPADSEHFADLSYPPARRPMVKFWFGGGLGLGVKVQVKTDRIIFRFPSFTVGDRTVFAPLAPITIEHWAAVLAAVVTGDSGDGILHTKPARDDEKGIELSTGLIFSDIGDDTSALKPTVDADGFSQVGATEETAFTLFHTPRPRLAERMSRNGVAPDGNRPPQDGKVGSLLQAVGGATPRQYHATDATDATHPLLQTMFMRGDLLEITSVPPTHRIVEQVLNDTDVVLSSAFPAALVPAAGVAYKRLATDRGAVLQPTFAVRIPPASQGVGPNDLQSTVPTVSFGEGLMVGDVVQLASTPPQVRIVVAVKDQTLVGLPAAPAGTPPGGTAPVNLVELDAPPTPFTGLVILKRLSDADASGFQPLADANDVFGDGVTVMNDAADLAALLCLGAASRLSLTDTPVKPTGAAHAVHRVSQVFRNWNLDRRRVNEWKMIVSGGAESERRGDYRAAEEAAPVDAADAGETFTDAFVAGRRSAEAVVLEKGWLGVFRSWVDMSSRARTDSSDTQVFRPGESSNRDLSRAMAYLIDAVEGVAP